MENTLDGINNRITEEEEQISELEDKTVKITAVEQNKEQKDHSRETPKFTAPLPVSPITPPDRDRRVDSHVLSARGSRRSPRTSG